MQITLKSKRTVVLSDSEDEEKNSKSEASKKNKNSPGDINASKTSRTAISSGELFKKKPITRIEESKMKKLQQKVSTIYQARIKRLMNVLQVTLEFAGIGVSR